MAHPPTPSRPTNAPRRRPVAGLAVAALAALSLATLAPHCGGGRQAGVRVVVPEKGTLTDEQPVMVDARYPNRTQLSTAQLSLDGVDLLQALGVSPPFTGVSGTVSVNGDPVTVSEFSFVELETGAFRAALLLESLATAEHQLEVSALFSDGSEGLRRARFTTVGAFEPVLETVSAAGLPSGPVSGGLTIPRSVLANASLGAPLSGPPVVAPSGASLRPGFVHAAEARIASPAP